MGIRPQLNYDRSLLRRKNLDPICVNGIPWTGKVITVGSGKELSILPQYWDETYEPRLYLVYPGTYTTPQYMGTGLRHGHIRGMGMSPLDVQFSFPGNTMWIYGSGDYQSDWFQVIENVYITNSGTGRGITSTNYANLLVNKCYLNSVNYAWGGTIASHWSPSGTNGIMKFLNCTINAGGYHFSDVVLSLIYIQRCLKDRAWASLFCTGSLAVDDAVIGATLGYGYEYGSYLITGV